MHMRTTHASPAQARLQLPPSDPLATHASLLERLKDLEDHQSWQRFYHTYRKVIFSFAIHHALTPTEAEEVVQEVVIAVARNLPHFHYDPARCSFKTWLFNLTIWRIRDQLRRRVIEASHIAPEFPTQGQIDAVTAAEYSPLATETQAQLAWETEWRRDLLARALERLKPHIQERHFQIFDLYGLRGWSAAEVSRTLNVSLARVYVTKHRVARLLRHEVAQLEKGG